MTESPQSRPDLSQVELLLDQQKYEEALAPLATLIEEHPSDLQIRFYRLLTVRILLLRQTLTQRMSESVKPPREIVQRISLKAAALQSVIAPHVKQWLHPARHAMEASRPSELVKRTALAIGVAGVFVTPITFYLGVAERPLSGTKEESFHLLNNIAATPLNGAHRIGRDWQTTSSARVIATSPDSGAALDAEQAVLDAGPDSAIHISPKKPRNRKPVMELQTVYRTRGSLSLREEPRFASASLQQIAGGTNIRVLGVNGKWLKVKPSHSSAVGYLRKEFLVAADTLPN